MKFFLGLLAFCLILSSVLCEDTEGDEPEGEGSSSTDLNEMLTEWLEDNSEELRSNVTGIQDLIDAITKPSSRLKK